MGNSHPGLVDVEVRTYSDGRVQLRPNEHHNKELMPVVSYEEDIKNQTTWCYEKETDTAVMVGAKEPEVPDEFEVVKKRVQTDSGKTGDNSGNITISAALPDEIFEPIKQSDYVELWVVSPDNSEWGIGYAYVYPAGSIMEHNQ